MPTLVFVFENVRPIQANKFAVGGNSNCPRILLTSKIKCICKIICLLDDDEKNILWTKHDPARHSASQLAEDEQD